MNARVRRWTAGLLALAIAGCQVLTYDVVDVPTTTYVADVGREPAVPVARVEHDALRDVLRLTVGSDTQVHRVTTREFERERDWKVEDAPFVGNLDEIDNELVWLIFLPIALSLDIVAMAGTFLVVPLTAPFADTSSYEQKTPFDVTEEVRWATFELVDPATDARLAVAQGEELRAHDLALLGFRSADLRAVAAGGEQVTLTLPPSAMTHVAEVQAALEQAPADGVVRVAPGASLADVVGRAPSGAWVQLEAGEYELPSTLHVFGKRLTIAGRGAGRTRLRSAAATGLSLSGAGLHVTLRGLSIAMDGAGPGVGVHCSGGEARLVACAVTGARHEKVQRTPEEVAERPGDVYRGGLGVRGSGAGKTTLVRCALSGNQTAGALAAGEHALRLEGCVVEGGVLEAVSFREASQGAVFHSRLTGPGHGVFAGGTAKAGVYQSDIDADGAGILAKDQAELAASGNRLHGCGTGISVEDAASATVEDNTCEASEGGILVSSTASVRVTRNTCRKNQGNGISVQGEAAPEVADNTCAENQTGLLCSGKSAGALARNTFTGNTKAGLAIQDAARPTVQGGVAEKNRGMGLFVDGAATPTISGFASRDNEGPGMQVEGQARPDVSYCKFQRNRAGLVLVEQAGGRFYNSSFEHNRGAGVLRQSSGGPTFPECGAWNNSPDWQ